MAKLLILLAAALLQVSAAPFDLNPITWAFKGPKMGLEIASKAIGGVREGLENNNMGFIAGPLGAVESGLAMPVGMLDSFQTQMPKFDIPSFGGEDGFLSGLTGGSKDGLGGMFGDLFAMPKNILGQVSEKKTGMFDGMSDMFGGLTGKAKSSMEKLQDALGGLTESGMTPDQIAEMIKTKGADAKKQVESAQKKVEGKVADVKKQAEEKVADVQKKVEGKVADVKKQAEDKVAEVQKQVKEQLAKVQEMQKEMGPKAQKMVGSIMADMQKQAAAANAAGDKEMVETIKGQMEKVVEHANELMTKLQAAKLPEEAQKIADQFNKDFTPLFEKAQK